MSNWIDVEDKPPEANFCWYLIFTEGVTTVAFFEKHGDGEVFWLCHNDVEDKDEWDNVTYWQPLPAPPKDE